MTPPPARVLVVDDSPTIRDLIRVNLELEGFQVHTAEDGQDALDKIDAADPHVVTLDVVMPRLDGWRTASRLRADPTTAHLPIIMVTAAAQASDAARARTIGVDAYLTKPFAPDELVSTVRDLAAKAAATEDIAALIGRARSLTAAPAAGGPRRHVLLGITGAPGAGKSTLADRLVAALAPQAVAVPMDGFHLANAQLNRLGRRDRKGAPDTFDAAGYVALLRRLRDPAEQVVYAPAFDRGLEEPVAGAIPVPRDVPLVITEGNYLLLEDGPWGQVRRLLDEVWYVDPGEDVRVERLIERHVRFGKSPEAARAWSLGTDQHNADLVAASRSRADLVIDAAGEPVAGLDTLGR